MRWRFLVYGFKSERDRKLFWEEVDRLLRKGYFDLKKECISFRDNLSKEELKELRKGLRIYNSKLKLELDNLKKLFIATLIGVLILAFLTATGV